MVKLDKAKAFLANNWRLISGAAVVVVLLYFAQVEYQEWKQYIKDQAAKPTVTTTLPPQIINTKTETIREVAVQSPSQEGAVLQFVERQGKVIAIVNGQEVEVPNVSGNPDVQIGENGELRFSTMTTTKIDVTDMANAQARLVADRDLAEQARLHEAEIKKEKAARNKERLVWFLGTVGLYLSTK